MIAGTGLLRRRPIATFVADLRLTRRWFRRCSLSRSKSVALAKKAKAVRLRNEGHTWDEVADGSGYANRGTAYRVVTNAHREQIVEDIESYRAERAWSVSRS